MAFFDELDDPRADNIRHWLSDILVMMIAASLCGATSASEFALFAETRKPVLQRLISYDHAPSHDTFSRILRLLDPQAFLRVFDEAARVEQRFGDCRITGARQVPVEGAQGRDQTFTFTEGTWRRSCPSMRDEPPEAQRRVGALWGCGVQRDERGHRHRAAGRINQPELMIEPIVFDHDVRAVVGIPPDTVAGKIRQ